MRCPDVTAAQQQRPIRRVDHNHPGGAARDGIGGGHDKPSLRTAGVGHFFGGSGTLAKTSATPSQLVRVTGQKITNARPTTASVAIVELATSWVRRYCSRESPECDRWSPITHNRLAGTVMSNGCSLARSTTPS